MEITIRTVGGYVGLARTRSLDTEALTPSAAETIMRLAIACLDEDAAPHDTRLRDARTVTLRVHGRSTTFQEPHAPEAWRALCEAFAAAGPLVRSRFG